MDSPVSLLLGFTASLSLLAAVTFFSRWQKAERLLQMYRTDGRDERIRRLVAEVDKARLEVSAANALVRGISQSANDELLRRFTP